MLFMYTMGQLNEVEGNLRECSLSGGGEAGVIPTALDRLDDIVKRMKNGCKDTCWKVA